MMFMADSTLLWLKHWLLLHHTNVKYYKVFSNVKYSQVFSLYLTVPPNTEMRSMFINLPLLVCKPFTVHVKTSVVLIYRVQLGYSTGMSIPST
jgi:hypothetical protein